MYKRQVLWCVALGVQAQDNQEYEKQVAKMLEMTHTMDAMKQIFPQMTAMLKLQLPQAPDEFWKELDASMNGMYDKIIKAVIPVYKKYLTLDDLKEIIKFYETPVGKKLSEMNPKATAEILPIAQPVSYTHLDVYKRQLLCMGNLNRCSTNSGIN